MRASFVADTLVACGPRGRERAAVLIRIPEDFCPTTYLGPGLGGPRRGGPIARSAGDLALAPDIIAGPDDADVLAYQLVLPPPRHTGLTDFRVPVVDAHPLLPTAGAVRAALDGIAERLAEAGVKIARTRPLLPAASIPNC